MVRFWASQGHTTEERAKFDREVDAPGKAAGARNVSQDVIDEEMALFRKAASTRQAGG